MGSCNYNVKRRIIHKGYEKNRINTDNYILNYENNNDNDNDNNNNNNNNGNAKLKKMLKKSNSLKSDKIYGKATHSIKSEKVAFPPGESYYKLIKDNNSSELIKKIDGLSERVELFFL